MRVGVVRHEEDQLGMGFDAPGACGVGLGARAGGFALTMTCRPVAGRLSGGSAEGCQSHGVHSWDSSQHDRIPDHDHQAVDPEEHLDARGFGPRNRRGRPASRRATTLSQAWPFQCESRPVAPQSRQWNCTAKNASTGSPCTIRNTGKNLSRTPMARQRDPADQRQEREERVDHQPLVNAGIVVVQDRPAGAAGSNSGSCAGRVRYGCPPWVSAAGIMEVTCPASMIAGGGGAAPSHQGEMPGEPTLQGGVGIERIVVWFPEVGAGRSGGPDVHEEAIRKADVLIGALGYIRKFHGRFTVIKLGGSVMEDPETLRALLVDVVFMQTVGMRPVVVHGGGKAITVAMEKAGLTPAVGQGQAVYRRRHPGDRRPGAGRGDQRRHRAAHQQVRRPGLGTAPQDPPVPLRPQA